MELQRTSGVSTGPSKRQLRMEETEPPAPVLSPSSSPLSLLSPHTTPTPCFYYHHPPQPLLLFHADSLELHVSCC